jgi:hypothetical protein
MFILIERFGQSYTFDVPEGKEEVKYGNSTDGPPSETEFKDNPEICLLEAVDAIANLLRCVFPEIEGHHLEIVCDNPEAEGGSSPATDGGIDLG